MLIFLQSRLYQKLIIHKIIIIFLHYKIGMLTSNLINYILNFFESCMILFGIIEEIMNRERRKKNVTLRTQKILQLDCTV